LQFALTPYNDVPLLEILKQKIEFIPELSRLYLHTTLVIARDEEDMKMMISMLGGSWINSLPWRKAAPAMSDKSS